MSPVVGCHYFPPGPQLPSLPSGVTAFRPVPNNTAWWQRHIGVRNLPKVSTPRVQWRTEPTTFWSQVWRSTTAPRRHLKLCYIISYCRRSLLWLLTGWLKTLLGWASVITISSSNIIFIMIGRLVNLATFLSAWLWQFLFLCGPNWRLLAVCICCIIQHTFEIKQSRNCWLDFNFPQTWPANHNANDTEVIKRLVMQQTLDTVRIRRMILAGNDEGDTAQTGYPSLTNN